MAKLDLVALFAGALLLASCSTLPQSGPNDSDILKLAANEPAPRTAQAAVPYVLLDLDAQVLSALHGSSSGSFLRSFGTGKGPAPNIRIGVGDVVQVTVFEARTGGLFIPTDPGSRSGNFVTLPNQTVDADGSIAVPYAGRVRASGRSVKEIQRDIESRLKDRAIDPQVIVTFVSQRATEVSVLGETNSPNKFPISTSGDRVLDAISKGGGIKWPGYETFVTLQRGKKKSTVAFETLVQNPGENVYVRPGDAIYVYKQPQTFLAYGASGLQGQFNFDVANLTFAEGVSKAGGLIDTRADAQQVFLYRLEKRSLLKSAGADLSSFPDSDVIPTIYRANFRNPGNFFLAQKLPMRDKDIIYIANADAIDLFKFFSLVNSATATVRGSVDGVEKISQ